MEDFCNICNICSLIKIPSCYKNPRKHTFIDLMLANSQKKLSCAIKTGLSDFHKMSITIMKKTFRKQEAKIIH